MTLLLMLLSCGAVEDSAPAERPLIETVCINELMARVETATDTDDWLELAGPPDTSLEGWSLRYGKDDLAAPLDDHQLDADGFLVLIADGKERDGSLPFRLDADGEALGLEAPDGSRERVQWEAVATDHSVARTTDCCREPDCWEIVPYGTPGQSNTP